MLAVNKQILHALRGFRGRIHKKSPHARTFRKSKLEPILMRDILSAKAAGKDHLYERKAVIRSHFTLWRNAKQHIYLLHDASSYKFDWLSTQSPSHLNKIMHICDTFIDSLSYFASEAVTIWRTNIARCVITLKINKDTLTLLIWKVFFLSYITE